jgi:hypothetical protein
MKQPDPQKLKQLHQKAAAEARYYDGGARLNRPALLRDYDITPATYNYRQRRGWPGLAKAPKKTLNLEYRQIPGRRFSEGTFAKNQVEQALRVTYPLKVAAGEWLDCSTFRDRLGVIWLVVLHGAETYGFHSQTVWNWIENGCRFLDGNKPVTLELSPPAPRNSKRVTLVRDDQLRQIAQLESQFVSGEVLVDEDGRRWLTVWQMAEQFFSRGDWSKLSREERRRALGRRSVFCKRWRQRKDKSGEPMLHWKREARNRANGPRKVSWYREDDAKRILRGEGRKYKCKGRVVGLPRSQQAIQHEEEAAELVKSLLAGDPLPYREVRAKCREAGFGLHILVRVRKRLRIVTRKVEKAGIGFWCLPNQSRKDVEAYLAKAQAALPPGSNNGERNGVASAGSGPATSPDQRPTDQPEPKRRSKRGRKRGWRDPEVQRRKTAMLEAWDRGEFDGNKAAAGRAYGFNRPDASTIINEHEASKA